MIEFIETPQSSNVSRYGYRSPGNVLVVTYKDRDGNETETWEYDAPISVFDDARKAVSIGSFISQMKKKYKGRKVN